MFYLLVQNNRPGHQDASHEPTLTFEAAASAGLDEGSPSPYPMLVGSTTARTRGMLTRVASWIAMTNGVSAAAICARAEVPPSSVSGARSASGKSLPDAVLLQYLCVPFLLNGWELCEATDISAHSPRCRRWCKEILSVGAPVRRARTGRIERLVLLGYKLNPGIPKATRHS